MILATTFSTSVRLVTSMRVAKASMPSSTMDATASEAPPTFTSVRHTRAPSRAKRSAVACPMPRLAPVTSATLPSSLLTQSSSLGIFGVLVEARAGLAAEPAGPDQFFDDARGRVEGVAELVVGVGDHVEAHVQADEIPELERPDREPDPLLDDEVYLFFGRHAFLQKSRRL